MNEVKTISRNELLKSSVKGQAGFSLVEILVALTLLGLVGTFVVGKIFDTFEEGRVKTANIQMSSFAGQLQEFRRKCNFYPDTSQGLDALISAPGGRECKNYPPNGFIGGQEMIPADPWDNEYVYESDGKKFTIKSFGSDGEEGGEGFESDLYYPKKKK
ncbi:MAG: type II secretion system protein GspG [Halobacteriovorax sp.]|nr:type II secretion system protein GspG [Halobacteriovorax sp.]|tara:strand:- start:39247 stop:39723 length:477 start_codon:yes stop_codon:yes gene_type:complete